MLEFESIENSTHSPKEFAEYLKGNVSLNEIVDFQTSLLQYNEKLQKEQQIINEWLNQCTTLLKERLELSPVA